MRDEFEAAVSNLELRSAWYSCEGCCLSCTRTMVKGIYRSRKFGVNTEESRRTGPR